LTGPYPRIAGDIVAAYGRNKADLEASTTRVCERLEPFVGAYSMPRESGDEAAVRFAQRA
jgi:hypothetical protein